MTLVDTLYKVTRHNCQTLVSFNKSSGVPLLSHAKGHYLEVIEALDFFMSTMW